MIEGLKGYPAYKESGVPWLGKVPAGWRVDPVRRMGRVQCGKALAVNAPGKLRPYLRVANVLDGRIDVSSVHTMPFTDEEFEGFRLREGDVLLNEGQSLELVGRAALYRGSPKGCAFQNSLIRVQAYEHALPQYLELLFRHAQASGIFTTIATQTTSIAHLGVGRLADLTLVLPPVDEQRAIVRFLGHLERHVRTYIAKRQRLIALLNEEKRAIIEQAVTRGLDPTVPLKESGVPWLGKVPVGWTVIPLGRIAKVGNGSTPNRTEPLYWSHGEIAWLNSAAVNQRQIIRASEYVTGRALQECHLPQVAPGSIVVAISGQGKTRGTAALLKIEATINQHLAYVTFSRPDIDSEYALYVLTGAYSELRARSESSGGTRGALTCGDIKTFPIAFPPLEEQHAIVAHLDSTTGSQDSAIASIRRELDLLRTYRTRLVSDVVSGKFDVREAAVHLPEVLDDSPLDDASSLDTDVPDDDTPPDSEAP